MNRDSGFLDDIGHAAQFLVLFLQLAEIRVTSCKSLQPVLQIGIERVDIPSVIKVVEILIIMVLTICCLKPIEMV